MVRLATGILLFFISCTAPTKIISYTSRTRPLYAVEPQPEKIILLSDYNIAAKKYRDNKEELFQQLIDTMMRWAATRIHDNSGIETEVIRGYTPVAGKTDSTIYVLITAHKATHAIALSYFDVYFEQTHVDVTKESNGNKSREAYYDIIADISYSFYDQRSLIKQRDLHQSRYHSSRSVVSGLLAAGPNIVSKKNDAYGMALWLWRDYLDYYFPGEKQHTRPVFTGKGFESVGGALAKNDYETALIESMRFIDDADKNKAAKANYNCAVFMERKDQPEEVKKYLSKSLSLSRLYESQQMWNDYQ